MKDPLDDLLVQAERGPRKGYAIKIIAIPGRAPAPPGPGPYYVQAYDPDAHEGHGEVVTTPDVHAALSFEKSYQAWEFWRQQSKVLPLRPDGQPNRPLTAFTVTVEEVPVVRQSNSK